MSLSLSLSLSLSACAIPSLLSVLPAESSRRGINESNDRHKIEEQ